MATSTSSKQASWKKARENGKKWFEKVGVSVNKATNSLGAEAFWPTSLDKESDKAAKILRSFCIDGFHSEKNRTTLDHIPPEVIRNAKGLAIFTVLRAGFGWSGAGGSGVIVSKLPNGQWSPPSGILIHTLGWGLIAGADIYDCVCVINNEQGMEGFTRVKATIGAELSAAVGPLGGGTNAGVDLQHPAPVWSYTKAKGLYIGVQIDGTVIVERTSENERFYGVENIKNKQILAGNVQMPPGAGVQLWETLQASEGSTHDQSKLPTADEKTPGDQLVNAPTHTSQHEYDELNEYHPEERMDGKQ